MAKYIKDGKTIIEEGATMPGTGTMFPIMAAADLLQHDGYIPYVEDAEAGTDGEEQRDGARVWVHYTGTAVTGDQTDEALGDELLTISLDN